ncbi:ADP-ribosylglycohydrolase family protein [Streptomyces bacillaris]
MITPRTLPRADRVAGAVVGSAAGDALGAPFEFGPAGVFSARFPDGVGLLCGGGGWEGTAVFHELLRVALTGEDPLTAVPRTLDEVHPDHRPRWATALAPGWHPALATEFNGAVWPCLATALWALRTTDTFTSALAAAVDVGGDTDTVAAVTGGLAGAVYGIDAVPDRWTTLLHVPLPGYGDRVLRTPELLGLAARLDSEAPQNYT